METQSERQAKNRWYRVSLRTFLLVMCVASVVLGQFIVRAKRQQAAVRECIELGGEAVYQTQYNFNKHDWGGPSPATRWYESEWVRDYLTSVVMLSVNSEHFDASHLRSLPHLDRLSLFNAQQSEIEDVGRLSKLKVLQLQGQNVSDLGPLCELHQLEQIGLVDVGASDISFLSRLDSLQSVAIVGCQIENFESLAKLKKLLAITISRTPISDEQIAKLRRELPGCTIQVLARPNEDPEPE